MPMTYGLTLSVTNSNKAAYYYINLDEGQISGGGSVTIYPSSASQSSTYVNIQSDLAIQAPAGRITGGMVVIASPANVISGSVGVSPAISAPVTATLYGNGGAIGSVTVPAGGTSQPFSWNVADQQALAADARAFLTREVARPEASE